MKSKIKLIEERVQGVVARLQTLTRERDRLQEELRSLEQRLESAEEQGELQTDRPILAGLDQIGGSLREAIAELRRESR